MSGNSEPKLQVPVRPKTSRSSADSGLTPSLRVRALSKELKFSKQRCQVRYPAYAAVYQRVGVSTLIKTVDTE